MAWDPVRESSFEVVYARPDRPAATSTDQPAAAVPLKQALRDAKPGTLIKLLPGHFTKRIQLRSKRGSPERPIIVLGDRQTTVVDGAFDPVAEGERLHWPNDKRFKMRQLRGRRVPFFRLTDCAWIEFQRLAIRGCWPFCFYAKRSSFLTLSDSAIRGSTYPFYVDDEPHPAAASHHILVEDNDWVQDPTGNPGDPATMQSWVAWTWRQQKRRREPYRSFMNGGLFGSEDIAGTVIVRRNKVSFAFNGVRMAVHERSEREEEQGPGDCAESVVKTMPDLTRNTNVEVSNNTFSHIRDNAVEPEHGGTNWWVFGNTFENVHKIFSFHHVAGGFWYIFGNVGGTEAVAPAQFIKGPAEKPKSPGGKVFKFLLGPPLPEKPGFAFHNSWRPRGAVLSGNKCGEMRNFRHYNNAVEHCAPVLPSEANLWCGAETMFAEEVSYDPLSPYLPDAHNEFDHDVTNYPTFPTTEQAVGQQKCGRAATGPLFEPENRAAYVLTEASTARGAARAIRLLANEDWPGSISWHGDDPDAGAAQPNGRYGGPAFWHLANPLYDEPPRLVRVSRDGVTLALDFSVTLDPSSVDEATFRADWDDVRAVADHHEVAARTISLAFSVVPPGLPDTLFVPAALRSQDGIAVSSWGAEMRLVIE